MYDQMIRSIVARIRSVYPEFQNEEPAVLEKSRSPAKTKVLKEFMNKPEFVRVVNKTKIVQDFLKALRLWPLPGQLSPARVANNILDFLIDPTRIPVEDRVYFRPEEILRNESYMKAKAEAFKAYKDQKHNSDFYPNRTTNREATIMDRKSLIASFDILSKNFKNSSDPIAHDLQVMARALSKMSDEELSPRLASEAPDLETVLAAKTFKCPECGTNVLEQTGYCVKCKKKVKKATEEKEAVTQQSLMNAFKGLTDMDRKNLADALKKIAPRMKKDASDDLSQILASEEVTAGLAKKIIPALAVLLALISAGGARADQLEKAVADTTMSIDDILADAMKSTTPSELTLKLSPIQDRLMEEEDKAFMVDPTVGPEKKAEDYFFWTKEASDLVARTLASEVEDEGEEEPEEEESEEKKPDPKEEAEEPKESGLKKGPGIPDGTGPMSGTPECPLSEKKDKKEATDEVKTEEKEVKKEEVVEAKKEEKKEEEKAPEVKEAAPTVVNTTGVLASLNFAGIEMEVAAMDEVGELSDQEKANLSKLF